MSKKIFYALFCLFMGWSLYIYFQKKAQPELANLNVQKRKTAISFLNGVILNYEGETLTQKSYAELGTFVEPNVLKLQGKIVSWRNLDLDDNEYVSCNKAIAYFDMQGLGDLQKEVKLNRVDLKKNVVLRVKGNSLSTDFAQYFAENNNIVSNQPVRVAGKGTWLMGDRGFTFDLKTQSLNLPGKVKGVIRPDVTKM